MGNCILAFWSVPMANRARNAMMVRRNVELTTDWPECRLSNQCRSVLGIEGGMGNCAFWHQERVASRTQQEAGALSVLTGPQRDLRAIASYRDSGRPVTHFQVRPPSARCDGSSAVKSS
jgi:hypothetical protein